MGNPHDHVTQSIYFVDNIGSIQGMTFFKYLMLHLTFYSNKVQIELSNC